MRAFGYVRVSRVDQAESGLGLDAQQRAIRGECERRGWDLVFRYADEALSGKDLKRPALQAALAGLGAGEADVLLVAKLDRLSRSLLDFAGLMGRARREGWALVALDLGVDTSTPAGALVANVMASFAQFERELIGERTKAALAELKARGEPWVSKSGRVCSRLGRPGGLSEETRARVRLLAGEHGYAPTARLLNAEGVESDRGGRWWASSVRSVVMSG